MKKLGTILFSVCMLVAGMVSAQGTTSIYDIQYTTDSSGNSPMDGETVTIQGLVTGESYAYGGSTFYVQDSLGAWSGIMVYSGGMDNPVQVGQGDLVTVTGAVSEYYGMTELGATAITVDSMWAGNYEPIEVSSGDIATDGAMAEAYESVLVKVGPAAIANADLGNGEWSVDDGSGAVRVDDAADYYFWPSDYDSVRYVVGPLNYSFSNTKIEPRLANDVRGGGDYIRLQAIQQVRGSDLARINQVANDDTLDYSYYYNYNGSPLPGATPYKLHGIVTMPTGLSYAGAGVKFLLEDVHGGPWSGIQIYSPDSLAFPVLHEGYEIEVEGYVGEYVTAPANMTEFWVSGEVNILNIGQPMPPVPVVPTGDLRWATTAEQWATVIVRVKDVAVMHNDWQYAEWGVDDGSGEIHVDDDSDSLSDFIRPPVGTVIDSIQGWVYDHYGYFSDSSVYKLEPLYKSDIVIGEGPPNIRNYTRTPGAPTPSDNVTISADISDNSQVTAARIIYTVNNGTADSVDMSPVTGTSYSGEIPAQSEGDWVDYYIKAYDDNSTSTTMPSVVDQKQYSYRVTSTMTIEDLQYTPWPDGQTPYEGVQVQVSGVVTADTAFNSNEGGYVIQDPDATEWGGIYVYGTTETLLRGNQVTVTGKVGDFISAFTSAYGYQWDGNTTIAASNVTVDGDGTVPDPLMMTADSLESNPETYEGMLVRVNGAEVSTVNQYDWTITDDSGGHILIDDDAMTSHAFFDTLEIGSMIGDVQGIWTYSYGTYKIELRDDNDHNIRTGVNPEVGNQPLTYQLKQNYPNPFNPTTNIQFSLAHNENVTIAVYNIRGQLIRTLVNHDAMKAGYHTLNWDGTNNAGQQVGSGIYIYRIHAGDFVSAKKMTLLR